MLRFWLLSMPDRAAGKQKYLGVIYANISEQYIYGTSSLTPDSPGCLGIRLFFPTVAGEKYLGLWCSTGFRSRPCARFVGAPKLKHPE